MKKFSGRKLECQRFRENMEIIGKRWQKAVKVKVKGVDCKVTTRHNSLLTD
jgi:hypothetical protein